MQSATNTGQSSFQLKILQGTKESRKRSSLLSFIFLSALSSRRLYTALVRPSICRMFQAKRSAAAMSSPRFG